MSMKKLIFLMAAIAIFVSCNQNDPTKVNSIVSHSTFFCFENGVPGEYDIEYYLKFDSPNNNMVTDSTTTKWYIEPASIDNAPLVWNYTVSGGIIKFERNGTSIDAIYSNDTVYFMQKAYVRLLH